MSPVDTRVAALNTVLSSVAIITLLQHIIKEASKENKDSESGGSKSQLGSWFSKAKKGSFFSSATQPLLGPQITVRLADGFCGTNEVHLSRVPHGEVGTASWTILLGIVHPQPLQSGLSQVVLESPSQAQDIAKEWSQLHLTDLVNYEGELCVKISRATLMTLFALTNARPIYSFSSAAGYRSAYPAYCGQWTISCPIGKPCIVRLAPHDSHSAKSDVYPPSFPARIDKCVEMMAGIVSDGDWKLAFPGRAKHSGPWILQERVKGFGGTHGSRHLYNMQGGKVFEVDSLILVPSHSKAEVGEADPELRITVPCLGQKRQTADVLVPEREAMLLARALDCLPWSSLSWSMHRGMKDLLLAYGKDIMDKHRHALASLLNASVSIKRDLLIKDGWAAELVDGPMASMAESAIMAGVGNSGDVVRIVAAIVNTFQYEAGLGDGGSTSRDVTTYWTDYRRFNRDPAEPVDVHESMASYLEERRHVKDMEKIVALTRYFVSEWSQELDYQLYHDLPVDVLLA